MSEAKNFGAGLLPEGACRCFYLKHDLGTDRHKDIHEKIDPERSHNTRIICGCCGEAVAGQLRPGASQTIECVWIPAKSAYFGVFRVMGPSGGL
jgi:hypothetical protein